MALLAIGEVVLCPVRSAILLIAEEVAWVRCIMNILCRWPCSPSERLGWSTSSAILLIVADVEVPKQCSSIDYLAIGEVMGSDVLSTILLVVAEAGWVANLTILLIVTEAGDGLAHHRRVPCYVDGLARHQRGYGRGKPCLLVRRCRSTTQRCCWSTVLLTVVEVTKGGSEYA